MTSSSVPPLGVLNNSGVDDRTSLVTLAMMLKQNDGHLSRKTRDTLKNILLIDDNKCRSFESMLDLCEAMYSHIKWLVHHYNDDNKNTLNNLIHFSRTFDTLKLYSSTCKSKSNNAALIPLAFLNVMDMQSLEFFGKLVKKNHNDFTRNFDIVVANLHVGVEKIQAHVFTSLKKIYLPSGIKNHVIDSHVKAKDTAPGNIGVTNRHVHGHHYTVRPSLWNAPRTPCCRQNMDISPADNVSSWRSPMRNGCYTLCTHRQSSEMQTV